MYLKSIGIPGHRFLDNRSRSAGEDTHSYVIYDDASVRSVAKYQRQQKRSDNAASVVVGEDVTHGVVKETPQPVREESFLRAVASQPIDQVFRIPFHVVGGLDQYSRWRVGKAVEQQIRKTAVERRFSEDGSLRFMNPLLEKVRAGVIDRYGLPAEYVEQERQRGVQEGLIAAEGRNISRRFYALVWALRRRAS